MSATETIIAAPAGERIEALDRRLVWGLGALLLLITVAVFHRVVGFELLTWDDDLHITTNEYYAPLTWSNLMHFWGYSFIYLYIPISYWFFAGEVWLSELIAGGDPAGRFNPVVFHTGSLLLHLGCTLLVYRLFVRLVRHAPAAFMGALLFAMHPLQGEAVCWVSETRGTLAALFSLLALHRYLDFVGVDPVRGMFVEQAFAPPRRRRKDYLLATFYFGLALLSKPSATSWPLVVVVIEVLLLRQSWKASLQRLAPWFVMAAVIMGLTKYYQRTELIHAPSVLEWTTRPLVAGDAYAFYLRKLVWPGETSFDYGRTPYRAAQSPWFVWIWLVPMAVAILLALDKRNQRVLLGGYLIFLVALAPVSGLVPFLFQSISTVADRYAYVPLIGLGLTAAAWIATRRRPEGAFILLALGMGLAVPITYRQTELWRDDLTVYGQGLKVNPRSYMAHLHLGNLHRHADRYGQAIAHYERVVKVRTDYTFTRYYIGLCYFGMGRYDDAIDVYRRILNNYPKHFDALCGLGQALTKKSEWTESEQCYRRAIEVEPKKPEPRLLLGEAYNLQDRKADADRAFREALELDDRSALSHVRYARSLVLAQRYADAIAQIERALELDPNSLAARRELAATLLLQGKFAPAITASERALELKADDFISLQTLGVALTAVGKNAEAAVRLEAALKLAAPTSADATAVRATLRELKVK